MFITVCDASFHPSERSLPMEGLIHSRLILRQQAPGIGKESFWISPCRCCPPASIPKTLRLVSLCHPGPQHRAESHCGARLAPATGKWSLSLKARLSGAHAHPLPGLSGYLGGRPPGTAEVEVLGAVLPGFVCTTQCCSLHSHSLRGPVML